MENDYIEPLFFTEEEIIKMIENHKFYISNPVEKIKVNTEPNAPTLIVDFD